MPSYYFIVQWPDMKSDTPRWTILSSDEAAIAYARLVIRELRQAGGYGDPNLTLLIRNAEGQTIASIPFRDVR